MTTGSAIPPLVDPGVPVHQDTRDITTLNLRGPGQDLLARALQVETLRKKSSSKKKQKKKAGNDKVIGLLRQAIVKKKKKKKKRNGPGGDPPSGSPSSSDRGPGGRKKQKRWKKLSDGTIVSCSSTSFEDSEASSSETSDLEPPLRKRSREQPGSVLELLVQHVQAQLAQSSVLDLEGSHQALTQGVKVSTYFSLNVRPQHPGALREHRELYMLARAIDALRSGEILSAADMLSARFMAIHQSLNDAGWAAARHMELTPLEESQAAAPKVVLATRKHQHLFQKVQGGDFYGNFARGGGRRSWSGWGNDAGRQDYPTKGKGKGKSKKGRGKRGKQGSDNPWAQSLEKTEDKTQPKS